MKHKKIISLIAAASVAASMSIPITYAADTDITLYSLYTFNETKTGIERTAAADRSGNGHNAKLSGNAKYVLDNERKSKVLYTNGLNGTYMEFAVPTNTSGNALESFTVSMDLKNLTEGNYFNFYIGDGSSEGTGKNYFGYKMSDNILLSAYNSSAEKKTTLSGKGVQKAWTHVDFVINNGKGTIYVDGANAGELDGYTMKEINAKYIRLSFSAWSADAYANCYYDNVAVYDKALTAEELKSLPPITDSEDNYNEEDDHAEYVITNEKDVDIQQGMFGLFFEDINYAADGGLYAEMIENRSFESMTGADAKYDGTYAWSVYPSSSSGAAIKTSDTNGIDTENNPHYITFTSSENQNGLKNAAYDGVFMEQGKKYNVSVYAKAANYGGKLYASVYKDGERVAHTLITDSVSSDWKQYTAELSADMTARGADFVIETDTPGTVDLDMISCIPQDSIMGVFRKDLAEKLKAIHPGFLRFPGGCIIEGYNLDNRYNWKNSIGDIAHRKQNWNRWELHTNEGLDGGYKHYNQTYGLGFYEYFELCEYLQCKAVPVVNVGMACQFQTNETVDINSTEFQQYIQDALDLIEFANGNTSTKYGAIRAEMGHPEPFGLEVLGVGNEQWKTDKNDWFKRYEAFEKAIHAKYPNIKLVATSGPGVQDDSYYIAWEWLRENHAKNSNFSYVVDEHYYRTPDWFYSNMNFYDTYPRDVKVFAGEYASRRRNLSNDPAANTWEAALSEAAYLTMVERNADVVYMASYAPLFARINYTQWSPDMIWFDDANSYGSPTYYVQKLYGNNLGDYTLKSTLKNYGTSEGIYSNASYDNETGDIIIKLANPKDTEEAIPMKLNGFNLTGTGTQEQITQDLQVYNTIANPENVSPVISNVTGVTSDFNYTVPSHSFTVLRLATKAQTPVKEEEQPPVLPEPSQAQGQYRAMSYTTGNDHDGGSLHIAVSNDGGKTFTAVNDGKGLAFAESGKAMAAPYIFKMADGKYGVIAAQTDPNQAADSDIRDGSFMLYTTSDFKNYDFAGYKYIDSKRLNNISCEYADGKYTISWSDSKGRRYSTDTSDFKAFSDTYSAKTGYKAELSSIPSANGINSVDIEENLYNTLYSTRTEITGTNSQHLSGAVTDGTYSTAFDASAISGSFKDYDISTDSQNVLSGWSSTWSASADTQKQMNCNFITDSGKQYFQFYGPTGYAPVQLNSPGYAKGAIWFALEFTLSGSDTLGCQDAILLDTDGKPFFGYAYAKNSDGFWPGDGERTYDENGNKRGTQAGSLPNFLLETGSDKCTYTNGKTVIRIIVDNNINIDGKQAYAVTSAYSNDGTNFNTISTRYYSGNVNGFGSIVSDTIVTGKYWYENTRYGNMKVYEGNAASLENAKYADNAITVNSVNAAGMDYIIYAAEYNSDGSLINASSQKCTGTSANESITIPFNKKSDTSSIKLFMWDYGNKPITNSCIISSN